MIFFGVYELQKRYGQFTEEEKQRIVMRVIHLRARFVQFKSHSIPAELRDSLQLDLSKLQVAVGAYWNDLNHLKQWHDITDKLHRSKVAAYTIKWLLHSTPIYSTLSPLDIEKLDEQTQDIFHNYNYLFAIHMMFFALDELDPKDFQDSGRYHGILRDLLYYMATGAYQEKMAALLFNTLALSSRRA